MAHDVFISYSSKDKPVADAVCAGLEGRGVRCWVAPRDILPGADWGGAIIDALSASKAMVLIFSSNANASPQIKREVERAVAKGVKLIGAVAAYRWAIRKSPPEIIAVNFPTSISAGSRDIVGTVQFKSDEAITQAQFDVVEAQRFDPFTIQPRTAGEKRGSFSFALHSNMPQQVTLKTTLIESEGRRSSPVSFSFEVRRASAAQPRSIEIDTGQFKFKIPH